MEKKIIYGIGRPRVESGWVMVLNGVLRLLFLTAKFFILISRIIFPGGIDNKKIIKE